MRSATAQVGLILLVAFALFLSLPVLVRPVQATDNTKWFVCKYTTTPGGVEVLQTGQNPISVSESAIPVSPVVPGAQFSDAQGRSIVLVEDTGQDPEPDANDCPPPGGPTPSPTPSPTATPTATPTASPTPTPTASPTPSGSPSIEPFRVITCPVTGLPIPIGMSAIEFQHPLLVLILLHFKIDGQELTPIPVETAMFGGATAALNSVEFIVEPGVHEWSVSDSEGNLLASGTVDCPVCEAAPVSPSASAPESAAPSVPNTALRAGGGGAPWTVPVFLVLLLLGLVTLNVVQARRR